MKRHDWIFPVLALLIPLIIFIPPIFSGHTLFWGLPILQFIPWRLAFLQNLQQGIVPLWNPLNGFGAPLMANYQSAVFYPPGWIINMFFDWNGIPGIAIGFSVVFSLHVFWAILGCILLGRKLGMSWYASAVAGATFGLNGYWIARSSFFSMIWTGAWIPWILLAASDIAYPGSCEVEKKFRIHSTLIICISMQLFAGHAQLTWYSAILCFAWVFLGAVGNRAKGKFLIPIGNLAIAYVGAVLLAGIQLIPTAEYLIHSYRSSAVDFEKGLTYSFWPWRFLGMIAPNIFGNPMSGDYWGYGNYWEDALYLGVMGIFSAFALLFKFFRQGKTLNKAKKYLVIFTGILLPMSIIFALGKNTPIYPFLVQYIPSFSMFNGPTRFLVWTVFALSILAGLQSDEWKPLSGKALYWTRLSISAGGAIVLGCILVIIAGAEIKATFIRSVLEFGVLLIFFCVFLLTIPSDGKIRQHHLWKIASLGFLLIDLSFFAWRSTPWIITKNIFVDTPEEVEKIAGTHRIHFPEDDEYSLKFSRYFRFESYSPLHGDWSDLYRHQIPNVNILSGISMTNNFDPLMPERTVKFWQFLNSLDIEADREFLRQFDIKAVETIIDPVKLTMTYQLIDQPYRYYWDDCPTFVQQKDQVLPEIQRQLTLNTNFPVTVIEGEGENKGDCFSSTIFSVLLEEKNDFLSFQLSTPEDGWFILSDTFYPGWEAYLDGQKITIYYANLNFRAVKVPSGDHNLAFRFHSYSYRAGFICTVISIAVIIILMFIHILGRINNPDARRGS